MFLEVGPPLLAAIFLDVNASVIAFMRGDVSTSRSNRLPGCQLCRRAPAGDVFRAKCAQLLDIVPLLGLTLVGARHWPQFLSLFLETAPSRRISPDD